MNPTLGKAVRWIGIYLVLVLAPLLILMVGPRPPGNGFVWDLSMALGFSAIAMLGAQFLLTARFRRLAAPFGIDILYYFHRYMAIFALALVLVHYGILRATNAEALGVANPLQASGHMTAGRVALACFLIVVCSSLWRRRLRLPYETWRIGHVVLTILGLILATVHIEGVDYYHEAPGRRIFWITFVSFWVMLVVHVRLVKPWWMIRRPYRIADVRRETESTTTIVVEPVGHKGLRFMPGQFAWVSLRASPFALREHPFSISSSAETMQRVEFTIKHLGDFTSTLGGLTIGEAAYLDGPYGAFTIDRYAAPGFVFIAGGVGIAPIMSMLRTLADRGDRRQTWLIYANDREESVIFREELDRLRAVLPLQVTHVLQQPSPGWPGECGMVTAEVLARCLPTDRNTFEYFLCGPTPMMVCVDHALQALGIPMGRMHTEIFNLV